MENGKTDKYTFGKEEKEIMLILSSFEKELGEKLHETKGEIERIKYYDNFIFRGIKDSEISGVFVVEEKDAHGNISEHVYYRDSSNEIMSIDSDGKMHIDPKWKDSIGDIDFDKTMKTNDGKNGSLKGVSQKMDQDEMSKKDNNKKDDTKEIEEEVEEKQGENLGLVNIRKVRDNSLGERMPEVFGDSDEHASAFSKELNRFVMLEKGNDGWQLNENVEPALMTWRTIISIDENGDKIEKKIPHALMETNQDDKEIAIVYGPYGEVNIETVDVLPCNERVSRQVRQEGEGIEKEETFEIKEEFRTEGKEYKHDIAHQVNEIEDAKKEITGEKDVDITPEDCIPGSGGITWGQLMQETGESLPKLVERYNREVKEHSNTKDTRGIVESIIDDYQNVSHEHVRGPNN